MERGLETQMQEEATSLAAAWKGTGVLKGKLAEMGGAKMEKQIGIGACLAGKDGTGACHAGRARMKWAGKSGKSKLELALAAQAS